MPSPRTWAHRLLIPTAIASGLSSSASCASSKPAPAPAAININIDDARRPVPIRVDDATPDASASGGGYTANARTEFADAEALFRARRFAEAKTAYAEVTRKYHYSLYAKRAELRIADILFERGELAAAASAYDTWAHDHRSDPESAAAARRATFARCRLAATGPCVDDYDAGP